MPSRIARWKALKDQRPRPVSASGVRLVVVMVPKGVSIARPPALATPPGAVWQTAQSPMAASVRPRSMVAWLYAGALRVTGAIVERQPSRPATTPRPPMTSAPRSGPHGLAPSPSGGRLGWGHDGATIDRPRAPTPALPRGGGSEDGFNAARTTSGVNGGARNRTPVASKIAFAIAAVPGTEDDSPAPSGGSPGRCMCMTSITGTSRKLTIG